jgi:hypothetical protein
VRDSESPTGKEEFGAFATQIQRYVSSWRKQIIDAENGTNSENKKNENGKNRKAGNWLVPVNSAT